MEENSIAPPHSMVVMGGSAGSLDLLMRVLPTLERSMDTAIVIILHRKPYGEDLLTQVLTGKTIWPVKEAEDKEPILPGHLYIAPADYHLLVELDLSFSLDYSEKINYSRPSIDATFETAALAYGPFLKCILLSGANADGVEGLKVVKEKGGLVAIQDPATAKVAFMPVQAFIHIPQIKVLQPGDFSRFISGNT